MVAAFLTLVGYSVNDTVVVFDRIRENRGKKRVITREMIDLSINQTLARTIKTSVTFLLAASRCSRSTSVSETSWRASPSS